MALRTDQQRKAIEVYCREVAKALWAKGVSMQHVMREIRKVELIPTQERIKRDVWNEMSNALFGKESSTLLEKSEVTMVYEVMNKWLGERFEIHVPFPHDKEDIDNYVV